MSKFYWAKEQLFYNLIICLLVKYYVINHNLFCTALQINRRTTGVSFQPYVKRVERNRQTGMTEVPNWRSYSQDEVITMLRVVNDKFSRVVTVGAGADKVDYVSNVTYYESNAMVLAAEAAALINRQDKALSLTMLHGLWVYEPAQQRNTEVNLALECTQRANSIYPGTVWGLVLGNFFLGTSLTIALPAMEAIKTIYDEVKDSGLKIGTKQICAGIVEEPKLPNQAPLTMVRRQMVNMSDFVVCEIFPAKQSSSIDVPTALAAMKSEIQKHRENLQEMFPGIEVMFQTGWPSTGGRAWDTKENLAAYWTGIDSLAAESNVTIWLQEAFDNPWKIWDPQAAHFGWWTLRRNADAGVKEGYIEKVKGNPDDGGDDQKIGMSIWVIVGITVGAVGALGIALVVIAVLCMRVRRLEAALTKEEIREFIYGMSDEAAKEKEVVESALRLPYDKSFEIPKDKFKIDKDALLGSGEFGVVYKAVVKTPEGEEVVVALKMVKSGGHKSALKGLLSEIKILSHLGQHPNIVTIVGAYTAEMQTGLVYLAIELCTLGNLQNYLRNCQRGMTAELYTNAPKMPLPSGDGGGEEVLILSKRVTFTDMVRWSHEIACGMEYLGTKHVIHADLSTRNVLLTWDEHAKITDFGLSRRLYNYTDYVKKQEEPLPWRWMAIESLKRLEFSSKSDVWSYGITLWEIFSMGDLPYPGLSWDLDFVEHLIQGRRLRFPTHANPEVYNLMVDCWNTEPQDRPGFPDLRAATGDMLAVCIGSNCGNNYVNFPGT